MVLIEFCLGLAILIAKINVFAVALWQGVKVLFVFIVVVVGGVLYIVDEPTMKETKGVKSSAQGDDAKKKFCVCHIYLYLCFKMPVRAVITFDTSSFSIFLRGLFTGHRFERKN